MKACTCTVVYKAMQAQQIVSGLHQHPGQEDRVWTKHTQIIENTLRGQPGEHEQSSNSMEQLYLKSVFYQLLLKHFVQCEQYSSMK